MKSQRMKSGGRANVVSSFTLVKGAMIPETYAVFASWDFNRSKRENLDRLRKENFIGATSETWVRDVAKVINRRFDPAGRDRPLVILAQGGCDLAIWRPLLLWHMTRDEFLLRDFLVGWLYPAYAAGTYRTRPEDLFPYLSEIKRRGGITEHAWSESTLRRVAAGLLKIATDFGLLKGKFVKRFESYHLPEPSFLYLLHAMRETAQSPRRLIDLPDWRMFFLRPEDVERELLRLHQFRKLEYQVAGSLVELRLPCARSRDFVEAMLA
jgi:bacteriophage exclusion system BrxA-like protein